MAVLMAKSPFTNGSGTGDFSRKSDTVNLSSNEDLWSKDYEEIWNGKWDQPKTVVNTGDGDDSLVISGPLAVEANHFLLTFKGNDSITADELTVLGYGEINTGSGADSIEILGITAIEEGGLVDTGSSDDIVNFIKGETTVNGVIKLGSGDDELLFGKVSGETGEVHGGSGFDRLIIDDYNTSVLSPGEHNFSDLTENDIAMLFGEISVSGFEQLVLV